GVIFDDNFDSDVYMIARMNFKDTQGLDAYSDTYNNRIKKHRDILKEKFSDQSDIRLNETKDEKQSEIDDGWKEIEDAKKELTDTQEQLDEAKQQLQEGQEEIVENEAKLNDQVASGHAQIDNGTQQIAEAQQEI